MDGRTQSVNADPDGSRSGPWLIAIACGLVFGVLNACTSPAPGRSGVSTTDLSLTIPTRDSGDFFLAEVMLNGTGPHLMLLDTGSNVTLIDRGLASQLAEAVIEEGEALRIASLEVGPVRLRDASVFVHDFSSLGAGMGEGLAGILGYPVFAQWLLTLDYPNRRVSITSGMLEIPDGSRVFALERASRPHLMCSVAGTPTSILIDSGASTGILLAMDLDSLPVAAPARHIMSFARIDGIFASKTARLDEQMIFGPAVFDRPIVSTSPESLIGGAALRHFKLTFDQRNDRIAIETDHPDPITSPPIRAIGASWAPDENGWRITRIARNGPAARAGVRPGDVIHSMNGELVSTIGLHERGEIASHRRHLLIEILRGDERIALEVEAEDVIP